VCVTVRLLQTQQGTNTFSLKKLHSFVIYPQIAVQCEALKTLKAFVSVTYNVRNNEHIAYSLKTFHVSDFRGAGVELYRSMVGSDYEYQRT
jgi:hypothetical protein